MSLGWYLIASIPEPSILIHENSTRLFKGGDLSLHERETTRDREKQTLNWICTELLKMFSNWTYCQANTSQAMILEDILKVIEDKRSALI